MIIPLPSIQLNTKASSRFNFKCYMCSKFGPSNRCHFSSNIEDSAIATIKNSFQSSNLFPTSLALEDEITTSDSGKGYVSLAEAKYKFNLWRKMKEKPSVMLNRSSLAKK